MSYVERLEPRRAPFSPALLSPSLNFEADYGIDQAAGVLSSWTDRKGIVASQASAPAKPSWGIVDGRPGITTDANKFLTIPKAQAPLPGTGATVYWVGSTSSALTVIGVWGLWGSTAAGNIWLGALNDATSAQTAAYLSEVGTNTNRASKGAGDPSDGLTHINTLRWTGSQVIAGLDGVSATPVACAGSKGLHADTADFAIGRYYAALANPAATVVHRALIVIPRILALDADEDRAMRTYLRRKWGSP